MPRFVVAECMQEVSSFNPVPSHFDDFEVYRGDEVFDARRGVHDEIDGARSVFEQNDDLRFTASYCARSVTSGGTLKAQDWNRLASEFLEALERIGPVDGAYFALHGAMASETEDDPEGYLLREARQILGKVIPFVTSLDLHGIVTDRMLEHSDAVVIYHTYPHVDFYETGVRSAKLLTRLVKGQVRPVTAMVTIPALVRGDELITETGSIGHCIRIAKNVEQSDHGLSAGMMIGNPFTDVPNLRSNSIVVMDDDQAAAQRYATEMANVFWKHHEKMFVPLTSLSESVQLAVDTQGTAVLMDAADATSSGASGDSNAIFAALLELGFSGTALIPIVDPPAVEKAFAAGVGHTIRTSLGGALDHDRFRPVDVEATVRSLSDGHFRSESFNQRWFSGKTTVLETDKFTFVVGSRPVSLFDRSFFLANGQDPRRFDAVVVKSPHCESHMFADWCGRLINVDAPGATSANLVSLGHQKCARPIFPLDEGVEFDSDVKVFRRI